MPLTLDQYADLLDGRADLPMPEAPDVEAVKAKPHLPPLPGIRAVLWTVYGTLLNIPTGELRLTSDDDVMMSIALEKTIHEFKMWASMSRKPGQPSDYMREIYAKELSSLLMASSQEKYPERIAEKVWESILGKLKKEYRYDTAVMGGTGEYSRKISMFFHMSLQGTGCYANADRVLAELASRGLIQGLLGDGQAFTPTQLRRGLRRQNPGIDFDHVLPPAYRTLSWKVKARKPADTIFLAALESLEAKGVERHEILHVGSSLERDIAPARKLGMLTCLFAGDKGSLAASAERLRDPAYRPHSLITDLAQVAEIVQG